MGYKMISLDTSSSATGYAIWINGILKDSGVINCEKEKNENNEEHIKRMFLTLYNFLKKEKPKTVVIERTNVPRNAYIQRLLSKILGIVELYCYQTNGEYVEYSPRSWRKWAKDKDENLPKGRNNLKKWSMKKVLNKYQIKCDDNESDAILIGLARINEMNSYIENIEEKE